MRGIFLVFITIFFVSCGDKAVVLEKKELPSWYKNPPQDSTLYSYSVGEGRDKQIAIADALSAFASTLSVSLSSEFSYKQKVSQGYISSTQSDSVSTIKSTIERIPLSAYETLKIDEFGFERVLVLIKVDKMRLKKALVVELEQKLEIAQDDISRSSSYNIAKKLVALKGVRDSLVDLEKNIFMIKVLDDKFETLEYQNRVLELQGYYDKLRSATTFKVQSTKSSSIFDPAIKSALASEKMSISTKDSTNNLVIFTDSKDSRSTSYGFFIASSLLNITIKDFNQKVVGANQLELVAHSTKSYEDAKKNLALKLKEIIEKDGISKVIGLEF
ncbi:MAG: LPP20 family lipoprotein [Sulfurimonas sp.]|jgi:hypothetical protein|nr:LPP20 family lipoprotein [Sulfurimonadaceae bacterium]